MSTEILNFTLEEFNKVVNKPCPLVFTSSANKNIYMWYKEYQTQKRYYKIEGNLLAPYADLELYKKFGILFSNTQNTQVIDREYLLILKESDLRNLEVNIERVSSEVLPFDAIPSWYVIEKNYKNYNELLEDDFLIKDIFTNINMFCDYGDLKSAHWDREYLNERLEELKGYDVIDIIEEVDKVHGTFSKLNDTTLEDFNALVESVRSRYKANSIIIYSGENNHVYTKCAAYLHYMYGMRSYLFSTNDRRAYLRTYADLLFDEKRMLVEDQVKYLLNMPDVMVNMTSYGVFFIVKRGIKLSLSCKYMLVDDVKTESKSSVKTGSLAVNKLNIIPLQEIADLDNEDIEYIRTEHRNLLSLISKFEKLIGVKDKILDVTNTFFFETEEGTYIAYIEDYNYKLDSTVISLTPGRGNCNKTFNMLDIKNMYPITVFADYKVYLDKLNEVTKAKESGKPLKVQHIVTDNNKAFLLDFFHSNGKATLSNFNGLNFVSVGLWWREAYQFRLGLYMYLIEHMKLENIRKHSEYISVFGGRHPLLNNNLMVTEAMLRS